MDGCCLALNPTAVGLVPAPGRASNSKPLRPGSPCRPSCKAVASQDGDATDRARVLRLRIRARTRHASHEPGMRRSQALESPWHSPCSAAGHPKTAGPPPRRMLASPLNQACVVTSTSEPERHDPHQPGRQGQHPRQQQREDLPRPSRAVGSWGGRRRVGRGPGPGDSGGA